MKSNRKQSKKNPKASSATAQDAALEAKCKEILNLETDACADECKSRHAIGLEIDDVRSEKGKEKYGAGAVKKIANRLARDVNTLYEYADVAKCWPEAKAFLALCGRTTATGSHLSFSHFVELAGLDDDDARDKHLERALAESMSVRKLKAAVAAERGRSTRVLSGTAKFRTQVTSVSTRIGALCDAANDEFVSATPEEIAEALREVGEVEKQVRRLAEFLKKRASVTSPTSAPLAKTEVPGRPGSPHVATAG